MPKIRLKYNPTVAVVDQTVLCNQACYFCWRSNKAVVTQATKKAPWHTMPWEMYCEIIDAVAEIETINALSLCGPMGDPALVADLCKRGRYAMDTGAFPGYVLINTNGYALGKHDPNDLLDSFSVIHISLDAIDPEIYGAIHNRPKQLPQVLRSLISLVKLRYDRGHGAEVSVRFTETKHNRDHWPDFASTMNGMGIPVIRKGEHSFIDVLPGHSNNAGALLCNQPYATINFNFRGEMTTCCINHKLSPTFGTLENHSLKHLWEGEEFENWRNIRHDGICEECSGLGGVSQRLSGGLSSEEEASLGEMAKIGEGKYNETLRFV